MFNHCPPKHLTELQTENFNGKRYYLAEGSKLPSITSVLGAFPKPALMEWRKRLGEEEANKISKQASSRGTKIHSLCELYLNNENIDTKNYMPDVLSSFYEFKPLLNNISDIHYQEAPLFSNKLKVAGKVDCLANYKDVFSVIDFKTSRKEKKEDRIFFYFIQCCFYSLAYYEMTGIYAKQIVVLISVDDGENQVFIKKTKDYIKPLVNKVKEYYKFYHV